MLGEQGKSFRGAVPVERKNQIQSAPRVRGSAEASKATVCPSAPGHRAAHSERHVSIAQQQHRRRQATAGDGHEDARPALRTTCQTMGNETDRRTEFCISPNKTPTRRTPRNHIAPRRSLPELSPSHPTEPHPPPTPKRRHQPTPVHRARPGPALPCLILHVTMIKLRAASPLAAILRRGTAAWHGAANWLLVCLFGWLVVCLLAAGGVGAWRAPWGLADPHSSRVVVMPACA